MKMTASEKRLFDGDIANRQAMGERDWEALRYGAIVRARKVGVVLIHDALFDEYEEMFRDDTV